MKRFLLFCLFPLIISLCGCENTENTETRFVLDTVATITANCDSKTISGAFSICEDYEKLLSRTVKGSDVYTLNNTNGFSEVSSETIEIINRSLYYSKITDGKFDITVYPVSSIWDFKNQIIPSKDEIAEALKNVDYESIEINGNSVNLNGKKIDLGSIAKGYIADKVAEYLKSNGATKGIVNLGGNVVNFGKKYNVGIMRPFSNDVIAVIESEDKTCVTSGIYQRYIKDGENIYHHIIDTKTGYGIQNELASVTVIGNNSLDCDALSTVCMLLGTDEGLKLIENTPDTEAVFIDKNDKITLSKGLMLKNNTIYFK